MRRASCGCGSLEHFLLELVEPLLELLDLGPVVVDHRVDDAVHRSAGPSPSTRALRVQTSPILPIDRDTPGWTVTR